MYGLANEMVFILYWTHAERRLDFEKRRKLHYNEFEALKLARKLMEEDEEEEDDGSDKKATAGTTDDKPHESGDKSAGNAVNNDAANSEVEMGNANEHS